MLTELVIDRIEGDYAVVEISGEIMNIPIAILPEDASEGDYVILESRVLNDKTQDQRQKIITLQKRLLGK